MQQSNVLSEVEQEQLDYLLQLEKTDSLGIFKQQSITLENNSDPIFVKLLKKLNKDPSDEIRIYNRMRSLEKLNIFIEEILRGADTSKLVHLFSKTQYKKYHKSDIVFEQGDPSDDKLYIILSGSVFLFIKNVVDFQDEEQKFQKQKVKLQVDPDVHNKALQTHFLKVAEKSEQNKMGISRMKKKDQKVSLSQKQQQLKLEEAVLGKIPLFVVVKIYFMLRKVRRRLLNKKQGRRNSMLESFEFLSNSNIEGLKNKYGSTKQKLLTRGSLFGEYALLSEEPRSATIVIDKEGTELLTIDKKDFQNAIQKLKQVMDERKQLIFQVFPDAAKLSPLSQLEMLYSFEPILVRMGDYITIDSLSREMQGEQLNTLDDDTIYLIEEGEVVIEREALVVADAPYHRLSKYENLHLTTLGKGQLIGDEILSKKIQNYEYTTRITSSRAILLQISMKNIRKRFPKEVIQTARKILKAKRQERTENYKEQKQLLFEEFNDPEKLEIIQREANQNGNINELMVKINNANTQNSVIIYTDNKNNQHRYSQNVINQFQQQNYEQIMEENMKLQKKLPQKISQKDIKNISENISRKYFNNDNSNDENHSNSNSNQKLQHHVYKKKNDTDRYTVQEEEQIIKAQQAVVGKQYGNRVSNGFQQNQRNSQKVMEVKNYIYDFGEGQIQQFEKSQKQQKQIQEQNQQGVTQPKQKIDPRIQKMMKIGQKAQNSHVLLKKQSLVQINNQAHYHTRDFYHGPKQIQNQEIQPLNMNQFQTSQKSKNQVNKSAQYLNNNQRQSNQQQKVQSSKNLNNNNNSHVNLKSASKLQNSVLVQQPYLYGNTQKVRNTSKSVDKKLQNKKF